MGENVLIVGLGSAGQRHERNALAMGLEVVAVDPRADPGVHRRVVPGLEEGIERKPLFAVVATPPDTHWQVADRLVDARIPVLVEKPPALTALDHRHLCWKFGALGLPFGVGYQFRATPSLCRLRSDVASGGIGAIYAAHAEFAFELAKWRPKLGPPTYQVDIIQEASHELDLLCWFLGPPRAIYAFGDRPRFPASVDVALQFHGGATATVHLDCRSPDYRRRLVLYGSTGTVEWRFDPEENEAAYVSELQDFSEACRGRGRPACSGWDALAALELIEHASALLRRQAEAQGQEWRLASEALA